MVFRLPLHTADQCALGCCAGSDRAREPHEREWVGGEGKVRPPRWGLLLHGNLERFLTVPFGIYPLSGLRCEVRPQDILFFSGRTGSDGHLGPPSRLAISG